MHARDLAKASVIAVGIFASGCVTLQNGRYEKIAVASEPAGATARIECRDGWHSEGVTPAVLTIPRKADACAVRVSAQGYEPIVVPLERIALDGSTRLDDLADRMHPDNWVVEEGLDLVIDAVMMVTTFEVASLSHMVDDHTGATFGHMPNRLLVRLSQR